EHLLVADVAHERRRQRDRARAIAHHRDLEVAELGAIVARRLLAAERRGGVGGEREGSDGSGSSCTGEHVTTGQFDHDVLPRAFIISMIASRLAVSMLPCPCPAKQGRPRSGASPSAARPPGSGAPPPAARGRRW